MCVDDEALMAGYFVIQGPACLVGNLGLPVNAAATGSAGRFVHSKNELAPDTETPPILRGEEVLHVTDIVEARRTTMKKVVRQSDDPTTVLGHECVNRFRGAEKALPSQFGDRLGQGSRPTAAIEGVIAVPEHPPFRLVAAKQGSDDEGMSQDVFLHTHFLEVRILAQRAVFQGPRADPCERDRAAFI
jgi:hypothetical protein